MNRRLIQFLLPTAFAIAAMDVAIAAEDAPAPRAAEIQDLDQYHAAAREAVNEVLARKEFRGLNDPEISISIIERFFRRIGESIQRLIEWLTSLPAWLLWVIIAWMVLTLIAILLHLIWTLLVSVGAVGGGRRDEDERGSFAEQLLGERDLDFQQILSRARQLAGEGKFSDAVRYFYVAALLRLQLLKQIEFHPAKTNRDYLRELQTAPQSLQPMQQMTGLFERAAYGGKPAAAGDAEFCDRTVEGLVRHGR